MLDSPANPCLCGAGSSGTPGCPQAQPSYRRVTEYNSVVNNNSHSNRMQSDRWTSDETEAFFSVPLPAPSPP